MTTMAGFPQIGSNTKEDSKPKRVAPPKAGKRKKVAMGKNLATAMSAAPKGMMGC